MSRACARTDSCPEAPSACMAFRESRPSASDGAEEFEPEASPVLGALGARLGAPGPAIQLGRHDRQSLTARYEECQMTGGTVACDPSGRQHNLASVPPVYNERSMRRLWRPVARRVTPYDAGKSLEALERELGLDDLVRLSANESPLGPSPRVVEAIRARRRASTSIPTAAARPLRAGARPRASGCRPNQIVVGNGADELIAHDRAAPPSTPATRSWCRTPSFEPYATSVDPGRRHGVREPAGRLRDGPRRHAGAASPRGRRR